MKNKSLTNLYSWVIQPVSSLRTHQQLNIYELQLGISLCCSFYDELAKMSIKYYAYVIYIFLGISNNVSKLEKTSQITCGLNKPVAIFSNNGVISVAKLEKHQIVNEDYVETLPSPSRTQTTFASGEFGLCQNNRLHRY